jgi:mediator of RNA polymerase II transcription subunit 7
MFYNCQDAYNMFGITFRADDEIIRTLESQGLHRLYPQNYDHKRELKKLNYSILVSFLDLLDVLIRAPSSERRIEKINDLTLLFIHMHHLINEFRPHQARETLRVMLETQRRQRLETVERFRKHLTRVEEMLQSCIVALPSELELDTKLVIKMEPGAVGNGGAGTGNQPSGSGASSLAPVGMHYLKREADDMDDSSDIDDESVAKSETLDQMMCDIVDNIP